LRTPLALIQNDLFDLGADLSVPVSEERKGRLRLGQEQVDRLEQLCDELNAALAPLSSFVLPGGSEAAARLHLARAICRRAEREAFTSARERAQNPLVAVYLNRLSDLLFVCARSVETGKDVELWRPGASRGDDV